MALSINWLNTPAGDACSRSDVSCHSLYRLDEMDDQKLSEDQLDRASECRNEVKTGGIILSCLTTLYR
jgi:hypothetical protein